MAPGTVAFVVGHHREVHQAPHRPQRRSGAPTAWNRSMTTGGSRCAAVAPPMQPLANCPAGFGVGVDVYTRYRWLPADTFRAAAVSGRNDLPIGRTQPHLRGSRMAIHGWLRHRSPRVSASSATIRQALPQPCRPSCSMRTTTSMVGTSGQFPRTEITPRDGCTRLARCWSPGHAHWTRSPPPARKPPRAAVAVPEPLDEPDPNGGEKTFRCRGPFGAAVRPRCIPLSPACWSGR